MRQVRSIRGVSLTPLLRTLGVLALGLSAVGVAGCGGGGQGFRVSSNPVVITNAVLPAANTGDVLNYEIPFTGGDGGAYILTVIDGAVPGGIVTQNSPPALVGQIETEGEHDFTLQLTDTGGTPHKTTTQAYHWSVGTGGLVFASDATLPTYIYNRFDTVDLKLVGGTSPYKCEVVIDGSSELLPTGLSIPDESTQVTGASIGVKSGGAPFVYDIAIKGTDSSVPFPQTVIKHFTLTVLVPEVVITSTALANGTCGQVYTSKVNIQDGIAPFRFNVVDALSSGNVLVGEPGTPAGVAKATGLSAYALDTDASASYSGKFPEGIYMRETTGDVIGLPRRKGSFTNWNFRVQSTVLPAIASQNKWKAFTFTMADSVPTNVALNNADLLAGNAYSTANNVFQGPEKTKNFNKQFTALNGCPQDGKYDAPHEFQVGTHPGEAVNRYDFSGTVFASGIPAGMAFSSTGLFSGVPTSGSQYQTVTIAAEDSQLPLPRSAAHKGTGTARFEIGPDTVVITESSQSATSTVMDTTIETTSQTVEILEPYSSGPVVRPLAAGDMAATHTHPTGNTLAGSLSSVDLLRVSVNPTWWAYDGANVNARGARAMQHADPERMFRSESFGSSYQYTPGSYPGQYITQSSYNEGRERASAPAIELPKTDPEPPIAVTHSPSTGVYTDGGRLYAYDNSTEFGFFIVRNDGKLFIPWAQTKSAGFTGLGDAWLVTGQTRGSQMRMPQITVSPDGRMAAAKVKVAVDNFIETAGAERIVIFSLTGEKMFGGATYRILTTGGAGNTNDGQYLYGSSLTLSNFGLYALRGNNYGTASSTSGDRVVFAEHWVYRATIFSPSTGAYLAPSTMALLSLSGGTNLGGWANTAIGTAGSVSCCFQRWSSPGTTTGLGGGYNLPWYSTTFSPATGQYHNGPFSTLIFQTNTGASVACVSPDFYVFNWANFFDSAGAPHPFRVSENGRACVIVGGANQSVSASPSTSIAGFLNRSVYVDYDHVFREAAGSVRRYQGPARTVGFRAGETYSRQYGWLDGPPTQLEVSDDGTKIAAIYNASVNAWYSHPLSNHYSPQQDSTSREELAFFRGTAGGSDPWSSKSQTLVTNGRFSSSLLWRLGCLAFNRDGTAVVFYGGMSIYQPSSGYYPYMDGSLQSGSMYAYTPGTDLLEGILPFSEGGHSQVSGSSVTYTLGSPNSTSVGSWQNTIGSVRPHSSFFSNDGNFYWIVCHDALTSSAYTSKRLVGVNVKDLSTTINSRAPIRAFAPTWTTFYPFATDSCYYAGYTAQYLLGTGNGSSLIGSHISADNGVVFYGSNKEGYYNNSNTWKGQSTGGSYSGGGTPNYQYYKNTYLGDPYIGGELFAMDLTKGGSPSQLSSLGIGSEYRDIGYIQPNLSGSKVAFSPIMLNTGNYYQRNPAGERLYIASGVTSSATGAVSASGGVVALEATAGRLGSSLAHDSTGTKVFYAFASSASNENGMLLVEKTLNSAGTAVTGTRTFTGVSNTAARFAVLWAGR